ncbi:MAG: hypothetical protein HUK15_02155 [Bacteroidales bacterium]|nr:hypothetical protein [Bacteroidales bacterium]
MKIKSIFAILATVLVLLTATSTNVSAQCPDKLSPQWYAQIHGGFSFLFVEGARKGVGAAGGSVAAGTYLTPIWGVRLQILGGRYTNPTFRGGDVPEFKFNQIGFFPQATFSVTNAIFWKKKGYEPKLNFLLVAGPGYIKTFGFNNGEKGYSAFSIIGALEVNYLITKNFYVDLMYSMNPITDKYNGHTGGFPFDGTIDLMIGLGLKF